MANGATSMRIELAGWSSKGLRNPDVEIDLRHNGTLAPISLIQMRNGTGKTTTLELLKAALNSEATQWTAETVRKYQRLSENIVEGQFNANLRIDGRPLSFELTLNHEQGHARYRTTTAAEGDVVRGWKSASSISVVQVHQKFYCRCGVLRRLARPDTLGRRPSDRCIMAALIC